jgi:dihydrofolate reductase
MNAMKDEKEIVITGGSYLFNDTVDLVNKLVITFVDVEIEDGDVFYPNIDYSEWKIIEENYFKKDAENQHDFSVKVFLKN